MEYCGYEVERVKFSDMELGDRFIDMGGRHAVKTGEFQMTLFLIGSKEILRVSRNDVDNEYLRIVRKLTNI